MVVVDVFFPKCCGLCSHSVSEAGSLALGPGRWSSSNADINHILKSEFFSQEISQDSGFKKYIYKVNKLCIYTHTLCIHMYTHYI